MLKKNDCWTVKVLLWWASVISIHGKCKYCTCLTVHSPLSVYWVPHYLTPHTLYTMMKLSAEWRIKSQLVNLSLYKAVNCWANSSVVVMRSTSGGRRVLRKGTHLAVLADHHTFWLCSVQSDVRVKSESFSIVWLEKVRIENNNDRGSYHQLPPGQSLWVHPKYNDNRLAFAQNWTLGMLLEIWSASCGPERIKNLETANVTLVQLFSLNYPIFSDVTQTVSWESPLTKI